MTNSNLVHASGASSRSAGVTSNSPLDTFKSIVDGFRTNPLKLTPLQLFAGSKRSLDQQVRADTFSTF